MSTSFKEKGGGNGKTPGGLARGVSQEKDIRGNPRRMFWLPKCAALLTARGTVPEPEIYFRIVHIAQDGHHDSPVAACRDQTVEIALWGPSGR